MPICNKCGKTTDSFGGEVYINGVLTGICQECFNKDIEEKTKAKFASEKCEGTPRKGTGTPGGSSGSPIGLIVAAVVGWFLMSYFLKGCR